ncbi:hypothetical protein JHS3_24100 [Jeongeupia sp. HS-3]|uniref:helix-turn-helix transcriptional regulator n=1 Tax=Jeongeupia sp. HS-3 TaxID=1009682 RepID=UPI0018A52C13|nr:helix-turn-helix domain-containing protein [Jeongeupia sp. HS-3]BCL76674.1 hypothetical protein JHS3_24100 [Jeongeupia sp. HS-3]
MEQLLSTKALAAMLGIAEQTIYNRHSIGGDLPPAIKLGHLLRFRASDVGTWIDAKCQPKTTPLTPPLLSAMPKRRGRPTKAEQVAARRAS